METAAPAKEKKKRLSKKRRGFAKDFALTGNATEAAVRNFDVKDRDVARRVGSELLTFPDVIAEVERHEETLKSALEKKGITPEKIADKVNELLESPNYKAINNGLQHATKIYGVEDEKPPTQGNTYIQIFAPNIQAKIKELDETIKAQLINHENPQQS